MRQEDAANLAGLSLRRYAAFERGEGVPPASMVDHVAAALQMSEAERSALHVLATGQDPPRPVAATAHDPPREPSQALRDMVARMDLPAALTDETWTLLHYNSAMSEWSGKCYETAGPGDRHLVRYLFAETAEGILPDVHRVHRTALAMLRYQYTRNLAPGFTSLVTRLTADSAEAARLWAKHEIAFLPHEYPVRVRCAGGGTVEAHVIFVPVNPRLWTYTMVIPPGFLTGRPVFRVTRLSYQPVQGCPRCSDRRKRERP